MTRKNSRIATAEEKALFEETFKETRPLADMPAASPRKSVSAKSHTGVDGNTAERLRRGTMEPDAKLDLHGFTEAKAHGALITFLRTAQLRGLRLVLIVTGKGGKAQDPHAPFDLELNARSRGVLKSVVPRWLGEPALAGVVAASQEAHRKHGGAGALYVYLRKKVR
ncbi:MAG TPA: Smr/MutS family protein [Rhizomicrobium sp.]|jgi:DNA-nicking Smr family endonuclease